MSPRPSLAARRRPQILAAACRVIGERGYDRARMTDVAAAAGVGTSIVQHYFNTRSELLCEAFWFANERSLERWREAAGDRSSHPWQRLEALIENSIPDSADWLEMYDLWFELIRVSRRDDSLLDASRAAYDRWREPILQPLRDGVEQGVFTPSLTAEDIADGVIGLCDGLVLQRQLGDERMPVARMRHILLSFLALALNYTPAELSSADASGWPEQAATQRRTRYR